MEIQPPRTETNSPPALLPGLSILIPAYNEEATLERVVQELMAVAPDVAVDFEILIIDDGSSDRTPRIAEGLAAVHPKIRVIHHANNLGWAAVERTGFQEAKLQFLTFVPADGQFPAKDLSRFLPYAKEADIVLGYRTHRIDGFQRRLQTAVFGWVTRDLLGLPYRDVNWVKLYRRDAILPVKIRSRKIGTDAEVLLQVLGRGGRIREVEVSYLPRQSGAASGSKFSVVLETLLDLLNIWKRSLAGKIS